VEKSCRYLICLISDDGSEVAVLLVPVYAESTAWGALESDCNPIKSTVFLSRVELSIPSLPIDAGTGREK